MTRDPRRQRSAPGLPRPWGAEPRHFRPELDPDDPSSLRDRAIDAAAVLLTAGLLVLVLPIAQHPSHPMPHSMSFVAPHTPGSSSSSTH